MGGKKPNKSTLLTLQGRRKKKEEGKLQQVTLQIILPSPKNKSRKKEKKGKIKHNPSRTLDEFNRK